MFKNNSKRIVYLAFAIISLVLLVLSFQKFFFSENLVEEEIVNFDERDIWDQENQIQEIEQKELSQVQNQEFKLASESNTNLISEEKFDFKGTLQINNSLIEFQFNEGEYLLDVMNRLKNSGQISFSGKEFSSMGFFVEEINGEKQIPKERKYWRYYVNSTEANVGISTYQLKNNDSIYWKLEAYK